MYKIGPRTGFELKGSPFTSDCTAFQTKKMVDLSGYPPYEARNKIEVDFMIAHNSSTINTDFFLKMFEDLGGTVHAFKAMTEALANLIHKKPEWIVSFKPSFELFHSKIDLPITLAEAQQFHDKSEKHKKQLEEFKSKSKWPELWKDHYIHMSASKIVEQFKHIEDRTLAENYRSDIIAYLAEKKYLEGSCAQLEPKLGNVRPGSAEEFLIQGTIKDLSHKIIWLGVKIAEIESQWKASCG